MQSWNSLPLFRFNYSIYFRILLADYLYFKQLPIVNLSLSSKITDYHSKQKNELQIQMVFGVMAYLFVFWGWCMVENQFFGYMNKGNFFANHLDDDSVLFVKLIKFLRKT